MTIDQPTRPRREVEIVLAPGVRIPTDAVVLGAYRARDGAPRGLRLRARLWVPWARELSADEDPPLLAFFTAAQDRILEAHAIAANPVPDSWRIESPAWRPGASADRATTASVRVTPGMELPTDALVMQADAGYVSLWATWLPAWNPAEDPLACPTYETMGELLAAAWAAAEG